ncbi:hypothetical protein [Methanospirillum lacunae]|uniref:Uncharacterized protein n=1 Tax=Methanospirillum lacunae TaxID=668570 RepID=A0A2V2N140_9EURY|nr:hypothetical protein [Methanospirillum lacunae]PWR71376.1 hypothetical protein DK846_10950 [Methanospirillum lacunae]
MPWKIPWQQKKPAGSDQTGSFYSHLRSMIGEIRRQGEPPVRDSESFSRYICDLCHRAAPVPSLRQCVICGRWACPECWKDEFYVCSSCNGIIRLHQIQCPDACPNQESEIIPKEEIEYSQ